MRTFLYTRVSTEDQSTAQQLHSAQEAGYGIEPQCVFTDHGVSGTVPAMEREGFAAMMAKAMKGDRIVVAKLDRIGRNAADILATVENVRKVGVKLVVLGMDGMDLTGTYGNVILAVLAGMAQLERDLISERTKAALQAKKARGERVGAIPKVVGTMAQDMADMHATGMSMAQIGERFGVTAMTVSRQLKALREAA